MAAEISGPTLYGPDKAETTFLCWGSTYGPLREAVDRLNAEQANRANMLHFVALEPFATEATETALAGTKKTICVEGNATGQLATLLRARTGYTMDGSIHRYDGRSFTPEYIISQVEV
jgi:2-oxoglutarate ferredoxin oxidoreductase subunit alpha